MRLLAPLLLVSCLNSLRAESVPLPPLGPPPAAQWVAEQWHANWIAPAQVPGDGYGVFLFRKVIDVPEVPARWVVHVSAEARFALLVNGATVARGPQRSDLWVSRYDSVDLAPWLRAGRNVIAVKVWSHGDLAPCAVVGQRTALIVQGDGAASEAVNTDSSWQVLRDEAYSPLPAQVRGYYVAGPGERVEASREPWGWEIGADKASAWTAPRVLGRGAPYGWGATMERGLAPRTLPSMEETAIRFASVRSATGVSVPEGFTEGRAVLEVPARTKACILLDQGYETNALPQLLVDGGAGAQLRLTYAEALVDADGNKGDRNDIVHRHIEGRSDEFVADGGRRRFAPLEFRTYRYVQLDVATGEAPLRIEELAGVFTAYPFHEYGSFACGDRELGEIWRTGWRTARLCAFETYMDCPYYEQLQYIGDTRIQALVSLYVAGDDRLMRNALEQFDRSRLAEGLTLSRAPASLPQVISPFSLIWVDMVNDYWMHRPDEGFVRERLPGVRAVLDWFERHIDQKTGLLGALPYWGFVDWTAQWSWNERTGTGGEPEAARTGGSTIISLQYAATLRNASQMFRVLGDPASAQHYEQIADRVCQAAKTLCWDSARGMFADSPARREYSQHANAYAVLSGAVQGTEATELMRRVKADSSLIQASTYFRFYLLRAQRAAGLGDEYLGELGPWRRMLAQGLTTFAETPDPTRSDCHAWSASPVYELLATVAGVEPAAPGFARVRIAPHPGRLESLSAKVVHPGGLIEVRLVRCADGGVEGTVVLPPGVEGEFLWAGQVLPLRGGSQEVRVRGRKTP